MSGTRRTAEPPRSRRVSAGCIDGRRPTCQGELMRGLRMATAVLAMLPPVAVVVFMQRLFVRGLVETEK